jgi:hypothetical protein
MQTPKRSVVAHVLNLVVERIFCAHVARVRTKAGLASKNKISVKLLKLMTHTQSGKLTVAALVEKYKFSD